MAAASFIKSSGTGTCRFILPEGSLSLLVRNFMLKIDLPAIGYGEKSEKRKAPRLLPPSLLSSSSLSTAAALERAQNKNSIRSSNEYMRERRRPRQPKAPQPAERGRRGQLVRPASASLKSISKQETMPYMDAFRRGGGEEEEKRQRRAASLVL